ncbi:hypothetical protein [Bifidobacterium callitrichos]|uniref:Uncharacterized protein n=1 Tax=Bifidobacterium callitrichos DSM 23973 TaxID=1437609 RepID=A0A087ACT7_9BIFI|nr:hypothetical protein [Bifidobacterium callitrichos]KFI56587.1 hypothetical protein BCAL_0184 [Bifidobacterium callitrichos DSM 23973]
MSVIGNKTGDAALKVASAADPAVAVSIPVRVRSNLLTVPASIKSNGLSWDREGEDSIHATGTVPAAGWTSVEYSMGLDAGTYYLGIDKPDKATFVIRTAGSNTSILSTSGTVEGHLDAGTYRIIVMLMNVEAGQQIDLTIRPMLGKIK